MRNKKKIALIIPSLLAGGAERVMSIIANSFSKKKNIEVHLILLTDSDLFYTVDRMVIIHKPDFKYKNYNRLLFTVKTFIFLRKILIKIKPDSLLSFGGRYNSFVIISSLGLRIKTYISERSQPGIKYGIITDMTNKIIYKIADGIIAQTNEAKLTMYKRIKHNNIIVIGNPFNKVEISTYHSRKRIVLNVGRFIKSKQQELLIIIFHRLSSLSINDWELHFAGDGPELKYCKNLVKEMRLENKVKFIGNIQNISEVYARTSIFAFTSVSEGFPNSLGEAMSHGLACISFNCSAGPSDLIEHNENGFLIQENDIETYIDKLHTLITNDKLRYKFYVNATKKMLKFNEVNITNKYLDALIN